jgi:hypothetical protein
MVLSDFFLYIYRLLTLINLYILSIYKSVYFSCLENILS